MTKNKPDEIQTNQSGDKTRALKTVKHLLPAVRFKFMIHLVFLKS